MSANLLQLLAADQALTLPSTSVLADTDIDALIDAVLPSNNLGAIAAENNRKLIRYLFVAGLRYSSVVQTYAGGEATKVLSAAGGKAIADSVAGQITAGLASLKADLLGGVGPAYDTLKELADVEITQQNVLTQLAATIGSIQQAMSSFVKADGTVAVLAPLPVADAAANGQAATLRQVEKGVVFGVANTINVAATGVYDMGATRATDAGATDHYFIPTGVYVCPKIATGTLLTAATLTVGTNAPAYDNIIKQVLMSAPVIGENIPLSIHAISIAPGVAIKARVLTAQVGGQTTYDVFALGFYR